MRLAAYPKGRADARTRRFTRDPLPPVGPGEVRVRLSHLSVDPKLLIAL